MWVGSIHLLWFIPILIANLALLALMGSLWFPPGLILLLGFTLFSGLAGVLQGTNTVPLLLKALSGIWVSALYACAFLRFMKFDAVRCFRLYAKAAWMLVAVGFFLFPVQLFVEGVGARFHSFEIEPGEMCVVCVPAIYYFADRWQRERVDGGKLLLMLLAVFLSRSSIGFMGLFVVILVFGTRYRFGKLFGPVCVALAALAIYTASPEFRVRVDDSITGSQLTEGTEINGSSFQFVSGAYVAAQVLRSHPLLGEGLGAISVINARHMQSFPGEALIPSELLGAASSDGGSLLFRLIAETGLIGLCCAVLFLWYCFPKDADLERRQTALALLVYVFLKFLREGAYFNPEVLFLFTVYAVNGSHVFGRLRVQSRLNWLRARHAEVPG